jgi:lipopolysaccharide export LptBFGC system permease protein LptF
MSKTTKIILGVLLSFIVLVGGSIAYVISAKFTAETYEQSVFAQDETMQNTWAQTGNMLKTNGITVKHYTEHDLKKIELAMKRYADKPQLMMIWAKEQGNTLSPQLHSKLMDAVEKVAAKKMAKQDAKISVVQEYRQFLNASIKGTIASVVFSYPSDKANKIMDRIISNKATKETWKTGEDEAVDPFATK